MKSYKQRTEVRACSWSGNPEKLDPELVALGAKISEFVDGSTILVWPGGWLVIRPRNHIVVDSDGSITVLSRHAFRIKYAVAGPRGKTTKPKSPILSAGHRGWAVAPPGSANSGELQAASEVLER